MASKSLFQALARSSRLRMDSSAVFCSFRPFTNGDEGAMTPPKAPLVDTLDLTRKFEKSGFPREQSEDLTRYIADILEESRERIAARYVPKAALERVTMEQEAKTNAFSSELQKAQNLQLGNVVKESERLQSNLDRLRLDVKHEIDKLTSSQRLDLNLEKGRMRDELHVLRDKTNDLELKIDREINALKAAVELTKNETIKYVVAILGTFMMAAIGLARLAMH